MSRDANTEVYIVPGGIGGSHCSTCGNSDTASGADLGAACSGHAIGYQMRFSFQPGDDSSIRVQSPSEDEARRAPMECHTRQRDPEDLGSRGQPIAKEKACNGPAESPCKITAAANSHPIMKESESSSQLPRTTQQRDLVVRCDSSSSTVTAVRVKSDRSAKNNHKDNQSGRPKFDRNSDSSEAVTAAKYALASSQKNALGDWKNTLGAQDEGSRGVRSHSDGEKGKSKSKGSSSDSKTSN